MKERNPLIDVLKGFTIILVVIGHACQWFSGDDRSQPLYLRFSYAAIYVSIWLCKF